MNLSELFSSEPFIPLRGIQVHCTHHSTVSVAAPRTRPASGGEWFVVGVPGL